MGPKEPPDVSLSDPPLAAVVAAVLTVAAVDGVVMARPAVTGPGFQVMDLSDRVAAVVETWCRIFRRIHRGTQPPGTEVCGGGPDDGPPMSDRPSVYRAAPSRN